MAITPALFEFLRELKANNNREWFQANKKRYEAAVKNPLLGFITDFGDRLPEVSPHITAIPKASGGSLFRIYRDLRFSKDKTPYKTAAAVQFRHESGKDVHAPGYYLHLEPGNVFFGAGIWRPDSQSLYKIRTRIAEKPLEWDKAIKDKEFTAALELGGESLKNPPRGFDPEHPLIEDLKRKDFICSADLDQETVCQEDFLDQYVELCLQAWPLMKFLTDSLGLPF